MHVFVAGLYGLTIWVSLLAFTAIVRADLWLVFCLGPVVVSGSMLALWALDAGLTVLLASWRRIRRHLRAQS
jgi:hypothetical protein